jgi:hypothetical protein
MQLSRIGEMFEQLSKAEKALSFAKALRQHVGRQHLLDDGHENGSRKNTENADDVASAT